MMSDRLPFLLSFTIVFLWLASASGLARSQLKSAQGDAASRSDRITAQVKLDSEGGSCNSYKPYHYFRDGDECKNALGDYLVNGNDLGNSITSTYSAVGVNGGMGLVDYEWDIPKNPGSVRLRIRGAVKNNTAGEMEINIWNGKDYVTVAKKLNANFERYEYSTIGIHIKDDRLTRGGYFAVQIVTDDGWWIDDVRADWTDSAPKIDLSTADVIEEGDRIVEGRRNESNPIQQSAGTCSISFTGFLFRAVAAYAQNRDSNHTLDNLASSVTTAAVGTVAEVLRRCEGHFKRAVKDVKRTDKLINRNRHIQIDNNKFRRWIHEKKRKVDER